MYKRVLSLLIILLIPMQLLVASIGSADEASWVWFVFFAILINIIMLIVYYYNIIKIKETHKEFIGKITCIEEKSATDTPVVNSIDGTVAVATGSIAPGSDKNTISMGDLSAVIIAENKLLNATESLIKFLRLKSKKIKIGHDEFNLNNVLNEVSGSLSTDFAGSNIELVFDIDNDIPKFLKGDPLHLGQILVSLLKNTIEHNPSMEVKLNISKISMPSSCDLEFKVVGKGTGLTDKELDLLSTPHYDEKRGEYVGMDFFVSTELVTLMDGKLTVDGTSEIGTIFTLTLPMEESDMTVGREDRLPRKAMLNKKVIVVDNNYSSASAIGKMLTYFNYDVDILSSIDFHRRNMNLYPYDILLFSDCLFRQHLNEQIEDIRSQKDLKVIRISNMFSSSKFNSNSDIIDLVMHKPFSHERIYEAIIELYQPKKKKKSTEEKSILSEIEAFDTNTLSRKESFYEKHDVTPSSFIDFAGTNLLIVEDNRINQKILTNVLKKAEMNITIANNGKEAVDFVTVSDMKFDFILMDINMPIMDGYDATSIIKSYDKNDKLPIVALTALVLESEISKMFRHGVNGYLSKPLKLGKLYSAFEFYLEKRVRKEVDSVTKSAAKSEAEGVDIDGIDIEKGLANANGSDALYKEVLEEFISAYGESDEMLCAFIKDKEYEKIKSLAIDMRGLTRTMGAYRMHDTAGRIYKLFLYGNLNMLSKHAKEYERDLDSLKNSITRYVSGSSFDHADDIS